MFCREYCLQALKGYKRLVFSIFFGGCKLFKSVHILISMAQRYHTSTKKTKIKLNSLDLLCGICKDIRPAQRLFLVTKPSYNITEHTITLQANDE